MTNQDKFQTAVLAFEQWRKTRTHGAEKIPDALRQQAVNLRPYFRVSHIIRALKLSHSQLKRWDHAVLKNVPAQAPFVKLLEENEVSAEVNEDSAAASLTFEWQFPQGAQCRLSGDLCATILRTLVQTLCQAPSMQNGGEA